MRGIVTLVLVTAVLAVVLGAILYGQEVRRAALGLGRRLRVAQPEPPTPAGPPIERLGPDLRRLRAATRHPGAGSHVQREATMAAYDDALTDALRSLDLPDTLTCLAAGPDREAERLRVEWLLTEHGMDLGRDEGLS